MTSQIITVPILGNRTARGVRTFSIQVTPPKGTPTGDGSATITIVDPNSPVTAFALNSQPGDYIGAGQNLLLTSPSSLFSFQHFNNSVVANMQSGDSWDASFAGLGTDPLAAGTYENAQRYPFQTFGAPGLDIDGAGRGCNTISGRFVIDDVVYSTTGAVQRFGAEFQQNCEMFMPPLFGSLRFNSVPHQISVTNAVRAGSSAIFTVTLNPARQDTLVVNFATLDGTAIAGADYTATSQSITFLPGELSHTVSVPLLSTYRGKKFFGMISAPNGGTLWIARGTASF
jgi:hypothetical protein